MQIASYVLSIIASALVIASIAVTWYRRHPRK